ncbi:MAG: 5-(carboxyamino)imidazole ribonucleotide synthase [Planctomycetota bacterium]
MTDPLPPGSPGMTLGMLGGGQLGRMFIHAAHRLGYRVHVLSPDADGPAGQIADVHTAAGYGDLDAVRRFAGSVAAVTYEFENVPADCAAACAEHAPVRPGQHVLAIAQNRVREKTTLKAHGIPVGPFAPIHSLDDLRQAIESLGLPGVLKTAAGGYDGKGQRTLRRADDATYAWEDLGRRPCVYEAFIDFEQEVSVVAARSADGDVRCYGPIANTHRNHILDVSVVPSGAPGSIEEQAVRIATEVMEKLDVVGVLCVEFFQTRPRKGEPGRMLVNELAPRPHNSGHLTIDAYTASQFDQQVRIAAGLPLAEVERRSPAAMVNLLGELWPKDGEPDWSIATGRDGMHLHLYGKHEARPGRKMGHLTALARTPHEAIRDAVEARARLAPRSGIAPD